MVFALIAGFVLGVFNVFCGLLLGTNGEKGEEKEPCATQG